MLSTEGFARQAVLLRGDGRYINVVGVMNTRPANHKFARVLSSAFSRLSVIEGYFHSL